MKVWHCLHSLCGKYIRQINPQKLGYNPYTNTILYLWICIYLYYIVLNIKY